MVNNMTLNDYLNKKKEFEFYVLNINKTNNDYQEIIDVFLEGIINAYIYENNNYTIIVSNVMNPDVNQLVNAIIEDFGYKLKVFKSNKILTEHIDDFKTLKKLYFKYQEYINDNFVNIQKLVQTILEKDSNDLTYIRPIILRKINSDPKLYEIVNGMFINDLNVCKTANYVYMHRNTINNKLNLIKEETGLDIQKFQEAVILYALIKR